MFLCVRVNSFVMKKLRYMYYIYYTIYHLCLVIGTHHTTVGDKMHSIQMFFCSCLWPIRDNRVIFSLIYGNAHNFGFICLEFWNICVCARVCMSKSICMLSLSFHFKNAFFMVMFWKPVVVYYNFNKKLTDNNNKHK